MQDLGPSESLPTSVPSHRGVSWTLVVAFVAAGLALVASVQPLSDPDIWWQVATGDLIRQSGVPVSEPWAFTALGDTWIPNAWLSSWFLSIVVSQQGWLGIAALTTLCSAILLGSVLWLAWKTERSPSAGVVAVLVILQLAPFLTARPQLISLVLTVWLASVCDQLKRGIRPNLWIAFVIPILWVNLHGMWVLAPIMLTVVLVGRILDFRRWTRFESSITAYIAYIVVLAALTPVGPRLVYWWVVVRERAAQTTEWQPLTFNHWYVLGFSGLILIIVLSWAFSSRRPVRSEALWVVVCAGMTVMAGRNLAPFSILLMPTAIYALNALAPMASFRVVRARWLVIPVAASIAISSLLLSRLDPVPGYLPSKIVAELKTRDETVKVLNDFNVGGYLTGVGAPQISVAIDGRIDVYDANFVREYLEMVSTGLNARSMVAQLEPDVAVLTTSNGLLPVLKAMGWRVTMVDGSFRLLEPPPQSG